MEIETLSLDDIIKKKRIPKGFAAKPKKNVAKANGRVIKAKKHGGVGASGGGLFRKPVVVDARNKIIQKHRSKIHDARDKLAQIAKRSGDVRQKLLRKGIEYKPKLGSRQLSYPIIEAVALRPKLPKRPYNHPSYIEHDIRRMETAAEYMPALRRTVKNDVQYARMPTSAPAAYKRVEDPRIQMIETGWSSGIGAAGSDPFDCYEVPQARPFDVSEPRNLNRQLTVQVRGPSIAQKPVRRIEADQSYHYGGGDVSSHGQRSIPSYDRYREGNGISNSNGQLSYEMRSRLHHAPPDPAQSMGIFSNPYASRIEESKQKPGYRIVVSNLHSSVTQNDVKELFEDIGRLLEARLVKSGVAEVIFAEMKDAETAVETYHNRQLDGQPMKCLLVNPRPSGKPTAPAIRSSKSTSSKSGKVEIDIDALHSVLFRRY